MSRAYKGFGLAVLLSLSAHVGAALTVADWRTLDDGVPKGPFVTTGVGGRYDIGSGRYTGLIQPSRTLWASDGSSYFDRYLQYACCEERDWSGLDTAHG